jgi:hypothetical protein
MPYNDPDPTDPQMLVGVVLPGSADDAREVAYVFAEEFARLGHDRDQILWLFCNPFYRAAHSAYRALGADAVGAIIDECVSVWGRMRIVDHDTDTPDPLTPRTPEPFRGG